MDVKITFIWHDCFIITLPKCVIITDYWRDVHDGTPIDTDEPEFLNNIPLETPLYVLVSHHHKDHFTRGIFLWAKRFSNIHYIISKDTARSINYILKENSTYNGPYKISPEHISILKPGESYADRILSVTAFASTDIGNSYLVQYEGKTIFHAGDLNAWLWKDESTQREIDLALLQFRRIVETIRQNSPKIDIAFFPVDSRIGTDWWEGASIFVRAIDVRYFIPMHFCLADSAAALDTRIKNAVDFSLYKNRERGEYVALVKPYTSCELQV